MKLRHLSALIILAVSVFAGCGATQTQLTQKMDLGQATGDASPIIAEGDQAWTERSDRGKAELAIRKWEEASKMDPTRAGVALKLAYGYYFMANVHVRWDDEPEDALSALFDQGIKVGERAILLQNKDFKMALESGKKWEDAVKMVPKEGIASLYWYATNLGKWSLLQGITTTLGNKSRIKSTMEHVLKLDETFFYGAPHRYFGVYEAKIPFGNIKASGESFDKAIKISNQYLDTQVLKAQYFAAKTQNESLFKELLNGVIKADSTVIKSLEVENRNAQRVAKSMLENIEDYF
jgi:hypothetical protein